MPPSVRSVALIGSYIPRRCGIATFTADLAAAITANDPNIDCSIVAMNDRPEGYRYPESVRFQINQDRLDEYDLTADFLNMRNPDVVCLQHEYGIFGGRRGSFILELVRNLNAPVITTFHTILQAPSAQEHQIIRQLAEVSASLVVMSKRGIELLRQVYWIPATKIELIHHGIIDVPFGDMGPSRSKVAASDKTVILTFGLLSPGKGIEYMVEALPQIVSSHPEVLYFVVGATHPHCKAESGEDYRLQLHLRAKELGVADHIVFHDRFVERDELLEFIRAADIYVTPYLNEAQITSGTLAYALGAGKVVVSTPYWHAQEMLAGDRGRLVPFRDSASLARSINDLLDHPEERLAMGRAAYEYCRPMEMKQMGRNYLKVFSNAIAHRPLKILAIPALSTLSHHEKRLPQINLKHLRVLTDGTGLLQHAKFTVPDRGHGYSVDDNARALIVAARVNDLNRNDTELAGLVSIYLSFLDDAFNPDTGRFRNFMSYDRQWSEETGSEDSHGRALWALGVMVGWGRNKGQVAVANQLFRAGLPALEHFSDSRAIAFPILGIQAYLRRNGNDVQAVKLLSSLGRRLENRFRQFATEDWRWHEEMLTYDNARLPQALMACGRITGYQDMVALGIDVLEWLRDIQLDPSAEWFTPIGNHGWFSRTGARAQYDQQPLEAAAMIEACVEAYECAQSGEWVELASTCFDWYVGKNDQQITLYDDATGGCRDGLQENGANENQGAESTLSYILSLLAAYNLRGLTLKEEKNQMTGFATPLAGDTGKPLRETSGP